MINLLVILRRELMAYYQSAIGYIFLIVFIVLGGFMFVWPFTLNPSADMREYFAMLPFFLCIFLPAVTMRSWAEERKENTLEMLLTFPMATWHLVLGKFLSALMFLCCALACTLTIPWMLGSLGRPDYGPIWCAYVGSLMLGAFFLSLGLFISSLSRDQIVSFLLSAICCFFFFIIGTDFIASFLDGWWSGFGTFLADVVGIAGHYNSFGRGVLELGDLLFFVGWTAVFLVLNWIQLHGIGNPGDPIVLPLRIGNVPIFTLRPGKEQLLRAAQCALILCIGLAANWVIAGESLGRYDLTEDQNYTISPATNRILSGLKVPVQVKVYITPSDKMPTEMKSLERDLLDKLDEMRIVSGGNVEVRTIHMEAANVISSEEETFGEEKKPAEGEKKEDVLEKRLLEKGVRPFPVRALREDQSVTQMVYAAIGIAYKDQKEEILPQVMPQMMDQMEYLLISAIYKLTRQERPKVALVAPVTHVNIDPRMARIYEQMGQPMPQTDDPFQDVQRLLQSERYEVARTALTAEDPLPVQYDTLVVLNPKDTNDRQRWELARALHAGKSVILAVQSMTWDYRVVRDSISFRTEFVEHGIDELLKNYGLGIDPAILMDRNHETLQIGDSSNPMARMMGAMLPVKSPTHIVVTANSMNVASAISARVDSVFYLWGSALTVQDKEVKERGLQVSNLFTSSPHAWLIPRDRKLTNSDLEEPADARQFPLAVLVTGQFPDVYAGKERPAWPPQQPPGPGEPMPQPRPEDRPTAPVTPKPGKLILVGCSEMFNRNFLSAVPGNVEFLLNAVDSLTLGEDIVQVRGKKRTERTMDKPSSGQAFWWKFANLGLVPLLIACIGIFGTFLRRQSREVYTMKFSA